ncbi:CAP domain-containing protein [Streptomyces humi]|uniref:CAP domain-containing protein n=1 Tax=Streptomyces humi TaxID=1428620 RepID=UPI0030B842C2
MVIAAAAVGAVGIPSAAMACTDWPGSGGQRSAASSATEDPQNGQDWWNEANWARPWNADQSGEPSWTASPTQRVTRTPRAAASAGRTTAPKPKRKPKATAPRHTVRTTPPRPSTTTAPPSTRNTTTAPSSTRNTTAAAAASAVPQPSSTPKATATASGVVARIVELVNAERAKVGCSALTLNATLSKVAQAHSDDMAAHQNMSHTGSDGSSPGDRITRAGYTWSTYGENVAYGYATPEQVMAAWMASPGHKANILDCAFKEIGVGLAQPNSYWTQDFGTAR